MTYSSTNGDGNSAPQNPWTTASTPAPQNPWAVDVNLGKFERNVYQINRKLLSMGSKYYVFDQNNVPLFFIDRPLLALKSEFTVYEDDTKTRPVMTVHQESAWTMINFTFIVRDENGQVLGYLRRQGWQSMLRRTWHIQDGFEKEVARATEDSLAMAIVRRLVGGHGLISMLVRTNFIVLDSEGQLLGEFNRRLTISDKHILDLSKDPGRTFDRRLAVALAIVLDNAEHQR